MTTLRIASRFRGPARSGNGGVSAGFVASALPDVDVVEVTLRAPPPLDVDLAVTRTDDGVRVTHGEKVIATARPTALDTEVPEPVDFETAQAATAYYRNRDDHPLPECFVCGTQREVGDALLIHPGRVPGRAIVAGPWIPDVRDDDGTGKVHRHVVWGALDCPSFMGLGDDAPFALLGRLSATIVEPPAIGERCVVIGWERAPADGRKNFGAAALFGADGRRLGWSNAVWIEVDPRMIRDGGV